MKNIIRIIVILLVGQLGFAQSTFVLNGKIKGMKDEKVYLSYLSGGTRIKDSTMVKDNKFAFKGVLSEDIVATLTYKNLGKSFSFVLAPGDNTVKGNISAIDNSFTSGSDYQDGWLDLNKKIKPILDREKKFYEDIQENRKNQVEVSEVELSQTYEKIKKDKLDEISGYINKKPGELAGLYAYYTYMLTADVDLEMLSSLLNKFDSRLKKSFYYEKSKSFIEVAQRSKIGSILSDFSQKDTADAVVNVSSFKGKYLLIDFWASWCGPCRSENPNVVAAYEKYHSNGFEILGVSLDSDKAKWMDAIHKDNLQWAQVSDLKLWKNEVAVFFGIRSIPTNFLIDPKGVIIAKNLRGENLEKKLAEIFAKKG